MILIAAAGALLAVKGGWAAYRDGDACRAVAEPVRRTMARVRPFAALAVAPGRSPVLTFKLGRPSRDARATLIAGGQSFGLAADRDIARTADPRAIDALRTGQTVTVRTRAGFEMYATRGAPTAIDAAFAACR